jgi:hypothetical protein
MDTALPPDGGFPAATRLARFTYPSGPRSTTRIVSGICFERCILKITILNGDRSEKDGVAVHLKPWRTPHRHR